MFAYVGNLNGFEVTSVMKAYFGAGVRMIKTAFEFIELKSISLISKDTDLMKQKGFLLSFSFGNDINFREKKKLFC